jgi:CheY-like chemotaxis protein
VPTSAIVHTDRRHLRRILQNLISNAIKYTATGGVVVGVRRAGENVCVVVADTGPGIEPEHREVIFKEFHRLDATATRVQGLGLGLSIVDRIARMLGAPISLRSRVGHGSAFSVRLPRARVVTAEPVAPPVTIAPARMSGLSVLCIDNEATVLDGMRTLLEGWQCRVDTAAGPGRALELFAADGRIPDILLVDYHLDRTTGIEAIDQLRAAWGREVPAIVITADNSLELHRAVRASGYGLLRKPLKAAALRAAIGQFTAVRSAAE